MFLKTSYVKYCKQTVHETNTLKPRKSSSNVQMRLRKGVSTWRLGERASKREREHEQSRARNRRSPGRMTSPQDAGNCSGRSRAPVKRLKCSMTEMALFPLTCPSPQMLLTYSACAHTHTHKAEPSRAGAAGSGGGRPGWGVCGVRAADDPGSGIGRKEQSGRMGIWSALPVLTLTSTFANKEPAGVSQPGRESPEPPWRELVSGASPWQRENRSVPNPASTRAGECAGRSERPPRVLFTFFFIFLHTGRSSEGA